MSIVAGVSLFDGILLAADARASYGNIRRDCIQKRFALAPGTPAVGFEERRRSCRLGRFPSGYRRALQKTASMIFWMCWVSAASGPAAKPRGIRQHDG
jgi:hypothetical protein